MVRPLDVRTLPRARVPTLQQRVVEEFWRRRHGEIKATVNFSEREIPMARLKKVICAQKGRMMMTFDTPAFLSKACELFVQELAIRAWMCAEAHHRCIILDSDIAEAIAITESYDFLIDILHAHWAQHNSTPRPKPTRKRRTPTDQSSSPRHPPHQHQVPQLVGYAPHIPIPPPVPTVIHHMPLSFPFLLQETPSLLATTVTSTSTPTTNGPMPPTSYITRGSDFFGNDINTTSNNIVAGNISTVAGVTTPLPGSTGGLPSIPSTYFYMNMMNMGNAGEHGALACNPDLFPLQFSCPLPVANNNDPAVATTIELNNILPEGAKTNSTIHASGTTNGNGDIDADAPISVDVGHLHQQEKETTNDHRRNVVHESVDVETVAATSAGGNKYNINEDKVEIVDEYLLDKFWEEIQINEELSPNTTSDDLLPLISTILDVEEFINDSYVLDGAFSNPSTNTNNNKMK